MDSKNLKLLIIAFACVMLSVIAFPLNEWLSKTMTRHQLIEIPVVLFLGVLTGKKVFAFNTKNNNIAVAFIIFVMASLIFWMLPKSVDLAAISPSFNKVMDIHIFVTGLMIASVLNDTIFEIKVFFLGMMAAMLMAVGVTLRVFDLLLCSSYSIQQQWETGLYMIILSVILFIYTTYVLISSIILPKP